MNFSGHYSNTDHIFILSNILFKLLSHTVKQCKKFLSLGNLKLHISEDFLGRQNVVFFHKMSNFD